MSAHTLKDGFCSSSQTKPPPAAAKYQMVLFFFSKLAQNSNSMLLSYCAIELSCYLKKKNTSVCEGKGIGYFLPRGMRAA